MGMKLCACVDRLSAVLTENTAAPKDINAMFLLDNVLRVSSLWPGTRRNQHLLSEYSCEGYILGWFFMR